VKKPSRRIRICSPGISRGQKIRGLRACIGELKALSAAAASILTDLEINPSAAVAQWLCNRFRVLQAYFSMRYREARELALAVLGSVRALPKSL
jgi:hypothetical protein